MLVHGDSLVISEDHSYQTQGPGGSRTDWRFGSVYVWKMTMFIYFLANQNHSTWSNDTA